MTFFWLFFIVLFVMWVLSKVHARAKYAKQARYGCIVFKGKCEQDKVSVSKTALYNQLNTRMLASHIMYESDTTDYDDIDKMSIGQLMRYHEQKLNAKHVYHKFNWHI